jgi:hypothetical protein
MTSPLARRRRVLSQPDIARLQLSRQIEDFGSIPRVTITKPCPAEGPTDQPARQIVSVLAEKRRIERSSGSNFLSAYGLGITGNKR